MFQYLNCELLRENHVSGVWLSVGWSVVWLVRQLVGRSVGWLVGWLIAC